jgi:hypothetical protein
MSSADAQRNRASWDAYSDEYQELHREFIGRAEPRWGMWQLPESELQVVGRSFCLTPARGRSGSTTRADSWSTRVG